MKKICLLIGALLYTGIAVQAQEVSLGVKGGLTIPNITPSGTNPLSKGYSSRLAWGARPFADFQFTKTFSLQVGLEYSGQGGKKDGMQALPVGPIKQQFMGFLGQANLPFPGVDQILDGVFPPDYMYAEFESKAKFDYLMLPVQAKFGWNLSPTSPFRVYVSAGLFASYLLKAERVSTGSSPFYVNSTGTTYYSAALAAVSQATQIPEATLEAGGFDALKAFQYQDNTQDITDEIKDFNFGFIGAVGISYQIAPRHKVFIEGGGNYGFIKIQKSDANGQNRIGAGVVMAGYSFTL